MAAMAAMTFTLANLRADDTVERMIPIGDAIRAALASLPESPQHVQLEAKLVKGLHFTGGERDNAPIVVPGRTYWLVSIEVYKNDSFELYYTAEVLIDSETGRRVR